MKLNKAKNEFIDTWTELSSSWGINKSMGMVHALLLSSNKMLYTDDIMNQLSISRGSVSMSLNELVTWGLIKKKNVEGDRKDYYVAEKDNWIICTNIMKIRKEREIDPALQTLKRVRKVKDKKADPNEISDFVNTIEGLYSMAKMANRFSNFVGDNKKMRVIKWMNKK